MIRVVLNQPHVEISSVDDAHVMKTFHLYVVVGLISIVVTFPLRNLAEIVGDHFSTFTPRR